MLSTNALLLTQLIWRKELEFGCIVKLNSIWQKYSDKPQKWRIAIFFSEWKYISKSMVLTCNDRNRRFKSSWDISEIIGHPVTLEDMFRWWEENKNHPVHSEVALLDDRLKFFSKWITYNPTFPLYSQSDETLTSIINIIKWQTNNV